MAEHYDFCGMLKLTTEKAVLIEHGEYGDVWVPKPQCKITSLELDQLKKGDGVNLEVTKWWLEQKG